MIRAAVEPRQAVSADPSTWPLLIGLEHLVALGLSASTDAARKLVAKWPPELRAPNTGRRCLFRRDAVLEHLGLK
jgi:hypothetical protein